MSELVKEITKESKLTKKGPCVNHEFEGEEYTQEAGKDVECVSNIPMEEEVYEPYNGTNLESHPESYSPFHDVAEKFSTLHPYEQNEILIATLKSRKQDVMSLTKDLDNKTKMYYPDDLLQLLFPNI